MLVACCLWPFLHVAEHNKSQLDAESFLVLLGAAGALALATLAIAWVAGRLRPGWGSSPYAALAVAVVLFFGYQAFSDALLGLRIPRGNYLYLALVIALPVAAWRLARNADFLRAALVFALAAAALPAAGLAWYAVRGIGAPPAPAAGTDARGINARERRNVYYVIVDGYGRQDQLLRLLGFDNRPAVEALRANGFFVAEKAYANYPLSFLSISSSFSAQYPIREGETFVDRTRFHDLIAGKNATVSRFKAAGYAYVHAASSVWSHSDCGGGEDYCVQTQHPLFGSTELITLVMEMTPVTYVRSRLGVQAPQPMNFSYLRQELERLRAREARPLFVFAHTFPPHPPWIYERDCRPRQRGSGIRDDWTSDARPLYLDNLQCVNRQMEEFVRFIVERDPQAIVVIQSDHGSAFTIDWSRAPEDWTREQFEERFAILMALRAPAQCAGWLRPDMTPVNVIPFVVGCLEGRAPEFREQKSLVVTESTDAKPRRVVLYRSE